MLPLSRVPRSIPPPRRPRLTPREQLDLLWEIRREVEESPTLDAKDVLPRVGHRLVLSFAEYCAIELVDGKGKLERHSVIHADPKKRHALAAISKSNKPDALEAKLGADSRLVMPVAVEGGVVGVLTLFNGTAERPFDGDDARFAKELSALLSLLLTRSRPTSRMSTTSGVVYKGAARVGSKKQAGRGGRGR
jgi:hypothetical protein